MKLKNYFVLAFVFTLIALCSSYASETGIMSALLESYYGVSLNNFKITGFTFIMNMALNFAMIYTGISFINDMFSMYNMIFLRCKSSFKCFAEYMINSTKICFVSSIIFAAVNAITCIINHEKLCIDIIFLTIIFFISYLIWFCIIGILFTFSMNYNTIFFIMILIAIMSPIINSFQVPVLMALVAFPIDFISNAEIIIAKIVLLVSVMLIWYFRQM